MQQTVLILLLMTIGTLASHAVGARPARMPALSGVIKETEFDNLFVLFPTAPGVPALVRLKY